MTVSATNQSLIYQSTGTTLLGVLAQTSANAAQSHAIIETNQVNNAIQKRLDTQIAALQNSPDQAVTTSLQTQVTTLQKNATTITNTAGQYGGNANILSDLQNQLAAMQTAASGGDGTGFDTALAAANTDVNDLAVIANIPPFQPDGIVGLKGAGLGIGSSSSYDLSTPTGQQAAATDVQNAQTLVGQIFQATSSNQLIAGSVNSALSAQINVLTQQLQQMQQSSDSQTTAKIARLTQQAQDQEHLIELAIGNTQEVSTALSQAANPPQVASSPFDVLISEVGATGSTSSTSAPAILSLLT